MNRIGLVASHEFMTNIKKPSFLVAVFGVPIFSLGLFAIIFFATSIAFNSGDVTGERLGYVDEIGVLADAVDKPEGFIAVSDEATAKAQLEDKTLEAYFLLSENFFLTGNVPIYANGSVSDSLEDTIEAFIQRNIVVQTRSNLSETLLEQPVALTVYLQNVNRYVSGEALAVLIITPLVFVMLFMMTLQFSSAFLMTSVVEEKSNRIMELLITSMTPMQLLAGKIIGLGGLGLVQIGIWALTAIIGLVVFQNNEVVQNISIPPDLLLIALTYFLLSYFLYGSLLAGVGAVVDGEQESRQYAGILSFFNVIPFFFMASFITDSNSSLAVGLSLFPFTSGIAMLLRTTFGAVPFEQVALSVGILFLTTIFVTWVSAKIFRWGLLLYGKRITPLELFRVIRGNPEMGYIKQDKG